MRLQFTCLIAAFTITAAYQIITGKVLSAAPSEEAADIEVNASLSSNFAISTESIAREPLLLGKEEADADTLEARLEAAFDALAEQQARTEESLQD
ncbi:MAG: hypothetical protein WCF66_19600, partial [Pseudolabrys sp.]